MIGKLTAVSSGREKISAVSVCGIFISKYLGIGTVSVVLNTEKYRQNTAKIPH